MPSDGTENSALPTGSSVQASLSQPATVIYPSTTTPDSSNTIQPQIQSEMPQVVTPTEPIEELSSPQPIIGGVLVSPPPSVEVSPMASAPLAVDLSSNVLEPQTSANKKSKIKAIIGLVVFIVIVGAGYGVFNALSNRPVIYSVNDLIAVKGQTYSVKHPKQWVDYSNNKDALKSIRSGLGSNSSDTISDQKIYAYKYDSKTDIGRTVLFTASVPLGNGISDNDLRLNFKASDVKKSFEDSVGTLGKDLTSGSTCAKTTNEKTTFDYPTSDYVVIVKSDIDCIYNTETHKKTNAVGDHTSLILKVKNGTGFMGAVVSASDDWDKNSNFYKQKVLESLIPN